MQVPFVYPLALMALIVSLVAALVLIDTAGVSSALVIAANAGVCCLAILAVNIFG